MAIVMLAVFAVALPASAKQFAAETKISDPTPRSDKARELRAQAEALYTQPGKWRKAARLLEQSAALRDANDPEAYSCLMYAGRIQASLGDFSNARANLEKAAVHALARGAVVEAAHAYIDAAHVASSEKQIEIAKELVGRATLLSQSPLLSDEQKKLITARLVVS
jgi:tetratricopeptide (TPR) repeat protein